MGFVRDHCHSVRIVFVVALFVLLSEQFGFIQPILFIISYADTALILFVGVMFFALVRWFRSSQWPHYQIWSFVGKKEVHKRPSEADAQEIGDAYTFIAIESTSKLIFAWHLGKRTLPHTEAFITKIRLVTGNSRFQISTDGFRPYVQAIDMILADRVDYSQVVKVYGKLEGGREARYSPGEVTDIVKTPVLGNPDMKRSSTSHIERQNVTLRQWCKRLTRLTYAFSKKGQSAIGVGASLRVL
jgi:IS1 family transposase